MDGAYGKWYLPTLWMLNHVRNLYDKGLIDTGKLRMLFDNMMSYRDGFAMLFVYDWINIPLVYTQVR